MSNTGRSITEGYQADASNKEGRGYQPKSGGNLDPLKLKPPKGDTAVQPPKQASSEKSS